MRRRWTGPWTLRSGYRKKWWTRSYRRDDGCEVMILGPIYDGDVGEWE